MSPAAGGASPARTAAGSFAPAPAPTAAAIGAPPRPQENLRDPAAQAEGPDPGNAAARKTAWNVPPPPPAPAGGGIIGGEESWPALVDAAPGRAGPNSASSDSLRSLSDGSAPSAPEDLIAPSVASQPVSNPISTSPSPSPASTSPPPSAPTTAPSPQNGSPSQPDSVRHDSAGHAGNNRGTAHDGNNELVSAGNESSRGRSTGNNSSDENSSSGGDGNWNDGGLGGGSNLNSSVHSGGSNLNSSVHSGGSSLGSSVHSGGIGGSGTDSSRRVLSSNNWNGSGRGGGGSNDSGNGSGDWGNRNSGGRGGGRWNNNGRNDSGSSNGFGGRGGRNRRDHDRGGNFSPRNYSRAMPVQQQQQQSGFYQPGAFQRPPPPPLATHFMMPPPYGSYVPPFGYPGDVQAFPYYVTPVEQQFQNMQLVQQSMQPFGVQQDQQSLQNDIRHQIEHYFSTDNLCHDTYLRERMDDQGWVPIDLIASFPRCSRFTMLGVDTNYILDSLRGSELLEVQGNNIRRRNDWSAWLLRRGPPPSN
ncbi:la-related protein 1B-like [Lolium rigidum]|uniref:la-related protein 1B-like n=1 Tax=Lolium rigidum TaxID=89674 RepID=UPI001F5DEFC7|nr:la-related protein 1B-like [Lolium rigidum]